MATLEELRARGPFVVDPERERVHRSEAMTPECAQEVDARQAQFPPDVLKASMVLKTRHYAPCPRCWAPRAGG